MSVRAYRINEIKYEESPTFNMWHNQELVEYLERENGIEDTNYFEVSVDSLEKAHLSVSIDDSTLEMINKDIQWAKNNNEDFIQYLTY